MDIFIWILIIGAVLSAAGCIIWVVFFVWLAKTALRHTEKELNQMFSQLERMLSHVPQGGTSQLNPQQEAQITQMLMQAQTQMGQLDDLARQRYETRVGDLMGMAADAGIDWNPY